MPPPFPGMDPFLERQAWEDFHARLITELADVLVPQVRPRYVVRVEERVYVEHLTEQGPASVRPDVTLLRTGRTVSSALAGETTAGPAALEPAVLTLPMAQPERETFLTVRLRESAEVVTVIEVLSPGNKRTGSSGRHEYLSKREAVLSGDTHLVELDLLRGGERLPTVEPLPPGDYYAFVARRNRRPRVDVYPWTLRDRLPPVPVPLAGDDGDVTVELQSVFSTLYDRAGYDYSLDYRREVEPPLGEADATWVRSVIQQA